MRVKRVSAGVVAAALAITGLAIVQGATPAAALEGSVPANAASSWQTNGTVWAIGYAKGRVYLGGDFTSVRPPGAAAGTGEVARNHLAAFDATTGALVTSFNHNVSASVRSLAASPDGSTMYVGGDFATIDGVTRNRVAAFATSTGALTSWAPSLNARVGAIAVSPSTVYVGGSFTTAAGRAVQRVAALNATSGAALTTFTTSADNVVYQMALSTDFSTLYLAGGFLSLNGNTAYHAAGAVSAATGANLPFSAGSVIPPKSASCTVEVKSVKTDANGAYFGAEGTGGGCFDGTFAANNDGSLKWQSQCLGATQSVEVLDGLLYTGSHSHDCSADQSFDPNAFPETGWAKGLSRHLLSRSLVNGKVGPWYPNTNGGPNGSGLGPRVMGTDGTQLFVGGEFTTVNGALQQGFTRFSPSTGDTTAPSQPAAPVAVARGGGKISVYVQAPVDLDDPDVTVRLYRDGGTTPIASVDVQSLFWRTPIVGFHDDSLAAGSSHTYRVDAKETNGSNVGALSATSQAVTVIGSAPAYQASVATADPTLYWRLGEPKGPAVADASSNLEGGLVYGTVSFGQPGAVGDGNTAITTDGATGFVASTDRVPSLPSFSVAAWFKTTSTSGGRIIGFGNRQGGYDFSGNPALSSNYDKHVYMTNDGRLVFGVYTGGTQTVTTPGSYNDGQWHQVVATQGSSGMTLYVDGARQGTNPIASNQSYQGYWRVGGDNLGSWPLKPTSNFFAGSIDEAAVYDHVLSLGTVQSQYAASGRTPPPSGLPTDAYGRAVTNDSPDAYWRLDETSGTTAVDSSGQSNPANYAGGVTLNAAGALGAQGHAAVFDGATGTVAAVNQQAGPSAYSAELWFKTTTTRGGKLIGFGNARTGSSTNYDRHVYMLDDGRLAFGVYSAGTIAATTTDAYNDGQWHQVVATQGSAGMVLYVDDKPVASSPVTTNQSYAGYWRVGGDNLDRWPNAPTSYYFAGTIDEVATYDTALSQAQVDDHYTAAGHTGPDVTAPTTAITSPADNATVSAGAVTVSAQASDNVAVTAVDLQVDGATVATDTAGPYTFTWNATDGAHTLTTVARDAAGNSTTSAPVHVSVSTPDTTSPQTAITSPADGATVQGPITVTATASDNVGVASVVLKVDGVAVATDSAAPYTFAWDAAGSGPHTLTTVATDAAGNTGTSTPVSVTVTLPPDNEPPTAPGALTLGTVTTTTVDLSWSAASDNRGVTGYQVLRDGTSVGSTVTGLTFTDSGLAPGTTYSYTVRAVDAAGNVGPASNAVTTTTQSTNPVLFGETWTGADGSAWPAAWTTSAVDGSVTTQGGTGTLAFNDVASAYGRAQLTGLAARADTELLTSFQWNPASASAYLNVFLRGSGGWQNAYRPKNGYGLQLTSNSSTVYVQKSVNGTVTNVRAVTGAQQTTTAKQWLRLRVSGSTIQFKTWVDGSAEPAAWNSTDTDTSVTAAGQLYLALNRAGSNVGGKAVRLDDLQIRDAS